MFPIILVAFALMSGCLGNRAFPLSSENYAIKLFQRINPNIRYDETNFLVDLSGQYVTCSRVGQRGYMSVAETLEDGTQIHGLIDSAYGPLTHVSAVNRYIQEALDTWVNDGVFMGAIRSAEVFGCSVRPGCEGNYVIGCVLTGMGGGNIVNPTTPDQGVQPGPDTQAFTPQQYNLAESITRARWDRSHFLENLSGYETECGMISQTNWEWRKSNELAHQMGLEVRGMVGHALNRGQTEPAMIEIVNQFTAEIVKEAPAQIGCSLVPDCVYNQQMYVVIGCLYEV